MQVRAARIRERRQGKGPARMEIIKWACLGRNLDLQIMETAL